MVVALDSPQITFVLPDHIPETEDDTPQTAYTPAQVGALHIPELVFGAASFSNQYNPDNVLTSDVPLRTTRLALRYGISAFDTSAYYGPSEIVLGTVLRALLPDFPRTSYKLMTKCGRYGSDVSNFDYAPETIRRSVERSLARLHTNYLDVVYLHDVEFVATPVLSKTSGVHSAALDDEADAYGLSRSQEARIAGPGDEQVLAAISELRKMQSEGLIRNVGISGYPLPTLLRLAILVLHTAPYQPLDVVLSYSHTNLQNNTFDQFASAFRSRAHVSQLCTASPLNMGLLTPSPPPWHPADPSMKDAAKKALDVCANWPGGLPNVALGYAFRSRHGESNDVPLVVGFSSPREVHESIKVLSEIKQGTNADARQRLEDSVVDLFKESGTHAVSWASP